MSGPDLVGLLGLRTEPVAIAFRARAPEGMPKVERSELASCGYWRLAAEGNAFYTDSSDHLGCPIGAHTHGVVAPAELKEQRGQELMSMLSMMSSIGYLKMDEVPLIPARREAFGVALYAPLSSASFAPDLVLIRGTPRQLMLVQEAAQAAGVAGDGATLGRPTCSVLPKTIQSEKTAMSLGCVGNRVYTEAPDDEAYVAVPGSHLVAIGTELAVILRANEELLAFHRTRKLGQVAK